MTRVRFLGTSAAEGFPAPFCFCAACEAARTGGSRASRGRQSLLINDDLIVDFGPDSYARQAWFGLDLRPLRHILQTHSHRDHFSYMEIGNIHHPMAIRESGEAIHLYGNAAVIERGTAMRGQLAAAADPEARLLLHPLEPGRRIDTGRYRITPVAARHAREETCLLPIIETGDPSRAILVGYDSAPFHDPIWQALDDWGGTFALVILDCTMVDGASDWPAGLDPAIFGGHMGLDDNRAIRTRMLESGLADDNTRFVSTHFAHMFNPDPERIAPVFAEHGFIAACDGLVLEL